MNVPPHKVQGTGQPLLYLPGLDGTGELFYRQLPELTRAHRVVTTSYRSGGGARFEDLLDDVEMLVATESEPVTLCAESFGGALGLACAARNSASIRCLVLANSFARLRQRALTRIAATVLGLLPRLAVSAATPLAARLLLLNGIDPIDQQVFLQAVVADGPTYAGRLRMLGRLDLREGLFRITCPVILIAGTADRLIDSVKHARAMAARLPRSRVVAVAGVGHLAFLDRRVNVAAILTEGSLA